MAAWAELEVLEESEVWAEPAATVRHNCQMAVAEPGSTTPRIVEEPPIRTAPLQTGSGVRHGGTHSRIVRLAPASSLAARAATFPAARGEGQA